MVTDGLDTGTKLFASVASSSLAFDIAYHTGGTFMSGPVNLYNIYYGTENSKSLMDYFATYIGNSDWYSIMRHYTTGTTSIAGAVTFKKSTSILTGTLATLTDSAVITIITNLFTSNTLTVDANGIYAFIFKGDIAFSGWLTQWCGYHSSFNYNGKLIKYFISGDPAYGTNGVNCQGYRGGVTANGNLGADSVSTVYAHELVETVSDCLGNAFYASTPNGLQENADLCAWNWISMLPGYSNANVVIGTKKFLLQSNWLPGTGCMLNDGTLSLSPTESPTAALTSSPSTFPTYLQPTEEPTYIVTSGSPVFTPTEAPTYTATELPSTIPTETPTLEPTFTTTSEMPATAAPSEAPSLPPSTPPTTQPSSEPTVPTILPSDSPSDSPSLAPTSKSTFKVTAAPSIYSPFKTLVVPFYKAYNTYSAKVNTVQFTFSACPGVLLKIADCGSARCFDSRRSSDQFIRLYNSSNAQVAYNDDSCSQCSVIIYKTAGKVCQQYTLKQGCYGDRFCTGNFTIQSISAPTAAPSKLPSIAPTPPPTFTVTGAPSSEPASAVPTSTESPTITGSNVVTCPFSAAAFSGYGYNVYRAGVACTFSVCPGMQYSIADSDPTRCLSTSHGSGGGGSWYSVTELIGVADENNRRASANYQTVGKCMSASLSYSNYYSSSSCKTYTLYMGCGLTACSGVYTILGTSVPTASPITRPSGGGGGGPSGGGGHGHGGGDDRK